MSTIAIVTGICPAATKHFNGLQAAVLELYLHQMALICRNCGSINTDPGGDPRGYSCGVCGMPTLQRTITPQQKAFAGGVAGAAIGALLGFGAPGALIGALIGIVTGEKLLK